MRGVDLLCGTTSSDPSQLTLQHYESGSLVNVESGYGEGGDGGCGHAPFRGALAGLFLEMEAMSTLLSFRRVAIVVMMVLRGTLGLAQGLDAKWLAGTWRRTEGPAGIQGTKFTYTLKRVGEDFEGTGYSHGSVRTFPVSLKKAK